MGDILYYKGQNSELKAEIDVLVKWTWHRVGGSSGMDGCSKQCPLPNF